MEDFSCNSLWPLSWKLKDENAIYDQNFDAFFDHVGNFFGLNFAVRNYVNKKLWKSTDSGRFLCLCLVTYTHSHTHTEKRGKSGNRN